MKSLFYNTGLTYDQNYDLGPLGVKKLKKPVFKYEKPRYKFLGFPIDLPLGIPAGPLLNSKFIKAAFDFGFSVPVYKTVRADIFPCHPYPNVLYVNAPKELHPDNTSRLIADNNFSKNAFGVNITNSFGVPSKKPKIWQKDVKKAKSYEKNGQLLILSFMGTVRKNQTQL